jgi:Zinc-binding dehydrogenase
MSTSTSSKEIKRQRPLPPPNSDFYQLAETLPQEELATLKQVRSFMESKVAPIINKYWVEDSFPVSMLEQPNSEIMNQYGIKAVFFFTQVNRHRLDKLAEWVDQNNIKVNLDKTFSLDGAAKALDYQKDNNTEILITVLFSSSMNIVPLYHRLDLAKSRTLLKQETITATWSTLNYLISNFL